MYRYTDFSNIYMHMHIGSFLGIFSSNEPAHQIYCRPFFVTRLCTYIVVSITCTATCSNMGIESVMFGRLHFDGFKLLNTLYCPMHYIASWPLWTLHKLMGIYMGLLILGVIYFSTGFLLLLAVSYGLWRVNYLSQTPGTATSERLHLHGLFSSLASHWTPVGR